MTQQPAPVQRPQPSQPAPQAQPLSVHVAAPQNLRVGNQTIAPNPAARSGVPMPRPTPQPRPVSPMPISAQQVHYAPGYAERNVNAVRALGQLMPGSMYGASALSPEVSNPKFAINPNSTPKAQAVFAPADATTQGYVNKASTIFQYTPQFKAIMNAAQPQYTNAKLGNNANLQKGSTPAAEYFNGHAGDYSNSQHLILGKDKYNYGSSPPAVTHEGLHAVYNTVPGTQQAFQKAYDQSTNPTLQKYLDQRLSHYAQYNKAAGLQHIARQPLEIQNEAHSFLSEYPDQTATSLPGNLQRYYGKYINANGQNNQYEQRYKKMVIANSALHMLSGRYPGPAPLESEY